MPQQTATTLISQINRQVECYRRLAALAGEQSRQVEAGDTERLLEVLREREVVTHQASALERELGPLKQRWPDLPPGWSAQDRTEAQRLFGEARDLLAQITARDEQDALALQQRRFNVQQQLQQSDGQDRSARRINRAYAAGAYAQQASRMDLRK